MNSHRDINLNVNSSTYTITLIEEPEGGFTASVKAFPGCMTYGKDLQEAIGMVKEAIEGYLLLLKDENESKPLR